jgi:type VI secretion system protein ImpM
VSAALDPRPGIYGKLPSNGDFVTRRLPATFLQPWDQWLQESTADSRDQLGRRWLEIYLTSPVWRFALSPGTTGQLPWAGVLMPSVDSVGRYWWSKGSDRIEPSLLLCQGLPPSRGFAAMLGGNWERWGWDRAAPPRGEGAPPARDAP